MDNNKYAICDECNSRFLKSSSKMESLCPECAHIMYGYTNCEHVFRNGRCVHCDWNGNRSEYIKILLRRE